MASRLAPVIPLLSFLVLLSVLESLLSFIFSALLGEPVIFPLQIWLELLAYTAINWFFSGIHALGVLLGAAVGFFSLPDAGLQLVDFLFIKTPMLPLALVYPALSIFDALLAPLISLPFFLYLITESFISGGPPDLILPAPGNVAFLIVNAWRIDWVITNFLTGLTWLGLSKKGVVEGWVFFAGLSPENRRKAWNLFGSEDGSYGDWEGGTGTRGGGDDGGTSLGGGGTEVNEPE